MYSVNNASATETYRVGYTRPTADQIGFPAKHSSAYAIQNRFRGRRMLRKIAALLKEPQLNAALRRSKSLNLSPTKLAPDPLGTLTWQSRTWRLINDPSSSVPAFLIGVLVLLFILLSCTSFVVESLPTLNGRHDETFNAIELTCVVVFSLEFLIRLISNPQKCAFFRDVLTWVDMMSILPYILERVLAAAGVKTNARDLAMVRLVRLSRVFRLLKLGRHSSGIQIFAGTLRKSVRPMITMGMFVGCGAVIIGSIMYTAERGTFVCSCATWDPESSHAWCDDGDGGWHGCVDDHPRGYWVYDPHSTCRESICANPALGRMCCERNQFQDIISSCYFALVTMTTVGYGDVKPLSSSGKFFASCFCVFGVVLIALPISVISANFRKIFFEYETAMYEVGEVESSGHTDKERAERASMRSMHENCNHDLEQLMMVYSHEEAATFDRVRLNTQTSIMNWMPQDLIDDIRNQARLNPHSV